MAPPTRLHLQFPHETGLILMCAGTRGSSRVPVGGPAHTSAPAASFCKVIHGVPRSLGSLEASPPGRSAWSCCPKAPPCLPISVDPCLDPYPRPGASLRSAPHAPAGLSPRLHSLVETPPPVPAWGSLLSPPTLRHRGHGGEREAVPLRPDGLRPPLHHQRQRVPWRVARPQPRHHPLRQLRLLHAHRVPVHHHGGLDRCPLLGTCRGGWGGEHPPSRDVQSHAHREVLVKPPWTSQPSQASD